METAQQQAALVMSMADVLLELTLVLRPSALGDGPILEAQVSRACMLSRLLFTHADLGKCYVTGTDGGSSWELWIGSTCFDITEQQAREIAAQFNVRVDERGKPA